MKFVILKDALIMHIIDVRIKFSVVVNNFGKVVEGKYVLLIHNLLALTKATVKD